MRPNARSLDEVKRTEPNSQQPLTTGEHVLIACVYPNSPLNGSILMGYRVIWQILWRGKFLHLGLMGENPEDS